MKRLLIQLILMLTLYSEGYSQSFAIKGGGNFSKFSKGLTEMKPGYQIGATIDIPIMAFLSFETGLFFANKGAKSQLIDVTDQHGNYLGKYTASYGLNYVDIPLTIKASLDVGWGKIYGLFGPYLGVGISGKVKDIGKNIENIKWVWENVRGNTSYLNRLDFGLALGIGIEFQSIVLNISNEYGLQYINGYDSNPNYSYSNRTIALSVGYKFGR